MNKENEKASENILWDKILLFFNEYKSIFLITLISGILIHLYIITNKLTNWDDIAGIFISDGWLEFGRWGINFKQLIFPHVSIPLFNGIMALIFVSLSACLICDILDIKTKNNRILIGIILVSFPVLAGTFSYMFLAHAFMLGFLLSVLSVYFAKKDNKYFTILSIVLLILSLSIYQAYISITATLLLILLIKDCINIKNTKQIIYKALKFLAILFFGLLFYMVITKIILKVFQTSFANYQSMDSMGKLSVFGIVRGIYRCYAHLVEQIIRKHIMVPTISTRLFYTIVILLDIGFICYILWKNRKNKLNLLMMLLFIILVPITMNMVYILNENVEYHGIMMYGDCFIYIILVLFIDKVAKKYRTALKFIIFAQVFLYIGIINQYYLEMQLSYENAYSFYQTVITNIMNTPGYDENSKISIIGKYNSKELYTESYKDYVYFTGIPNGYDMINAYSKIQFINYFLGFNGNFIKEDEVKDYLENNEEFKNMPIYPYYGSVRKIDDIIVVKLSDFN